MGGGILGEVGFELRGKRVEFDIWGGGGGVFWDSLDLDSEPNRAF